MFYATLDQAKREIQPNATREAEDHYIAKALSFASHRINEMVGFAFEPMHRIRMYDALGEHIDDVYRRLQLDLPLLAVTAITAADGTTLSPDDYVLESVTPAKGLTPYRWIRYAYGEPGAWSRYSAGWIDAIVIDGIWGHHRQYAEAWLPSGDSVQDVGGLTADASAVTVADADAPNYDGLPRFSRGQLVTIDDEWLRVLAVDTDNDLLTVQRGVNGSTAAAHNNGAPIAIWQPNEPIVRATVRWAAFMYQRRGTFEQLSVDGLATIQFPTDVPDEIANILEPFRAEFATPFRAV